MYDSRYRHPNRHVAPERVPRHRAKQYRDEPRRDPVGRASLAIIELLERRFDGVLDARDFNDAARQLRARLRKFALGAIKQALSGLLRIGKIERRQGARVEHYVAA